MVVDRIIVKEGTEKRIADSVEAALKMGKGMVGVDVTGGEEMLFSEKFACTYCGISLEEIAPRTFSFNSPFGACPTCHGLGVQAEFDPERIAPDKTLTFETGGLLPFAGKTNSSEYYPAILAAVSERLGFTMQTPLSELTKAQWDGVMNGIKGKITVTFKNRFGRKRDFETHWEGAVPTLDRRYKETSSQGMKDELEQYMASRPCPDCKGTPLKARSLGGDVRRHQYRRNDE